MRLLATFFVMCAASSAARASSTDFLIRAKSPLELELAIVESSEATRLTEKCRVELAGMDLPRTCFILMRTLSSPPPAWLGRVCEKRARGAVRVESLRELSDLPDRCREVATERLLDLEYRIEDEQPARLLEEVRAADGRSGS